jgi:glycosyltransferase involved in cell wall biosynthesis
MDDPLVSIAVVTYNQLAYIGECLDSCLAQDYRNIEIVVADDGSTDGTQDLLRQYCSIHPNKIKIILSSENKGITNNQNLAHFACSGKYIAWIGGDDMMEPDKISIQTDYMERNPDCVICYHNLRVVEADGRTLIGYFNAKHKYSGGLRAAIRYGTFNGASSTFVRRACTPINGFDVRLTVASDWYYWIQTLDKGGTIDYIDRVLGAYRRHSSNVSNTGPVISQGEVDVLLTIQLIICAYPEYFKDALINYASRLVQSRHNLGYFRTLWLSLRIYPSIRAFLGVMFYLATLGKAKM